MIEALADVALRCPRPVVEQDLSLVWALIVGAVGFAAGKLLGDRNRRIRIMRRRYPPNP